MRLFEQKNIEKYSLVLRRNACGVVPLLPDRGDEIARLATLEWKIEELRSSIMKQTEEGLRTRTDGETSGQWIYLPSRKAGRRSEKPSLRLVDEPWARREVAS